MSELNNSIKQLAEEFQSCQKLLLALGDENRQHLILEMMQTGCCNGVRVGTITEKTNLSRPAVSHHLRILKDAGIVKMRREGTKNYYYFDADAEAMNQQKFQFILNGNQVTAKAGLGFYAKVDLGIAKYHFEIGAGKDNFKWA